MEKGVYFILILCGIVSQGICHVSEENNAGEKSSNLLIRQKRLVGGSSRRIQSSAYLLNILKNEDDHCPATLLTSNVAISSAACFINHNTQNLSVLSRSTVGVKHHQITRVTLLDPNYNPAHPTVKNLALVKFYPPIHFDRSYNRPITIYSGNLATDHSTNRVVSWAAPLEVGGRRIAAINIETFAVLVISFEFCRDIYRNMVGNGNICATGLNAGEYCDPDRDSGVPLIKNNQLLGVFVYRGRSYPRNPDVFMNLLDHDIRRWIHEHVPSLNLF